jgi:membrane protein required for beta-lactamase induction
MPRPIRLIFKRVIIHSYLIALALYVLVLFMTYKIIADGDVVFGVAFLTFVISIFSLTLGSQVKESLQKIFIRK